MRDLKHLHKYRVPLMGEIGDAFNGSFIIPGPANFKFHVIASSEMDWDHVSVSLRNRCPNWNEMSFIKDLFFQFKEVCYQLHVTKEDHINFHQNTLHLWRPQKIEIPLPPKIMV